MDIDALLPGLSKLLEQRLGRTGYYIGNVVALFASAIIILIPLIMVGGALWVVYPELFTRPGEAIIAARQSIIVYGIGAALLIPAEATPCRVGSSWHYRSVVVLTWGE